MAEEWRRARERRDGFTAAKKKMFVEALGKTGTIADACRIAGVSRRTFYYHEDRFPDFAAACRAARARAAGAIETLAWERAAVGTPEKLIRGGEVVQIRIKPSDSILRLLLQASNPKKYGRMSRGGTTRRQIERKLRKEIEAELRAQFVREQVATNEEVREALVKRLRAFGIRVQAERAEQGERAERGETGREEEEAGQE
ncbi:MAG TPA: hypothetical protein VGD66_05255 [Allosphingosinicella sp.]